MIQLLTSGGPNYSTSTFDVLPLRKSLPIDRIRLCKYHRCLLGSDDCHCQLCSIQDPRKRRRILKKGDSYATYKKETFNSFYCYFNDHLALVDRTVHLSILLDLDRAFKSQPDTIMIPPQWFPKMPTMENFQQLMVQNPAMQWMWNSVFISLVTMFPSLCNPLL